MPRCGGCDTTWTGLGIAHCANCHATFTGITAFDRHQVAAGGGARVCVAPGERGLVQNSRGHWGEANHDYDWSTRRAAAGDGV